MNTKKKVAKETISFIILAFLVLIFRSVFFEPFQIPSGSMIPTLMIGDFILVNKFAYGVRAPFTDWSKIPFTDSYIDQVFLTDQKDPERGDVIVFKYPKDTTINYIKRVVGLPGDKVQLVDEVVYINGKPIETKEISGKEYMSDMDDKYAENSLKFFLAKTGKHEHVIQLDQNPPYVAKINFEERVVPPGHFFCMGDNRDHSSDSREWGFVPKANIKGKAIFVWFSMILPWSDYPFKIRPWRIGTLIK